MAESEQISRDVRRELEELRSEVARLHFERKVVVAAMAAIPLAWLFLAQRKGFTPADR